jgi:hypothetical protein
MLSGLGVFLLSEPPKRGSAFLKTVIIAEGASCGTQNTPPKISGTGALLVA